NENIHVAIVIVIAYRDAHARHFLPIGTVRDTGYRANLLKRAVVFVSIEVIRVGIVSYKQIGPAIVVEILKNRLKAEIKILVGYLGLCRYIGESPIAVVVVERVRCTGITQRTAGVDLHATVLASLEFRLGDIEVQIAGNE